MTNLTRIREESAKRKAERAKPNVAVLLSGGLDSTCLLASLVAARDASGVRPCSVSVYYGQKHERELRAAQAVADYFGIQHKTISLSDALEHPGSALTDDCVSVPRGHYAAETMKATVVPHRNLLMLTAASAFGLSRFGVSAVAYAAHAGDHPIYPDCRESFVEAARKLLSLSVDREVEIIAPYLSKTKGDIVKEGVLYGAPFALTWSCYEGGEYHCGECGTCVERREAFRLAGVLDPTVYARGARDLDELLALGESDAL